MSDYEETISQRSSSVISLILITLVLFFSSCASSRIVAKGQANDRDYTTEFADSSNIEQSIPTPREYTGFTLGEKAVCYADLERYCHALAEASPFVTLTPYAQSYEGRTLFYLTITSPDNHARLPSIKADNSRLADPRQLRNQDQADQIIENLPGIAWMAYSIHGDELSSTDAAVQLAYQLVAGTDPKTQRLRKELVIHIDPLMNPDGRERFLSQLEHLTGRVPNPDYQAMQHRGLWSAGRGNHYLFDLNRDWLMQVHPETRGRSAAILSWNPHLLIDSHEMGGLSTYLFDPPREPINPNLSEANLEWRRTFSCDHARAFDHYGWSYYTRAWHEEWYPGYTSSWASLLGSIGILYEQAGVQATLVKQASGKVLTYREAIHHHLVSSLANLETFRVNRQHILNDFVTDRQWAVSHQDSDESTFLMLPPGNGRDRTTYNRFLDLLQWQGIEVTVANADFEAKEARDVWGAYHPTIKFRPGTVVINSKQPHRRLLHAILDFDPHMSDEALLEERIELEKRRGSRTYDVTAWNLPMAYGLKCYWAKQINVAATAPAVAIPRPELPALNDQTSYGYLLDGAAWDINPALVRLLDQGCKPLVATKLFTIGDQDYLPGTVLLRRLENPPNLPTILRNACEGLNVELRAVPTALSQAGPDLGGSRFRLLQPPRVAIASQWPIGSTSFGAIWHLLDARLGLRASPINIQRLSGLDLRKYNILIIPNARGRDALAGVLNEDVVEDISAWVKSGGTLIAMGDAAAFFADQELDLSSVRLKRDVLDQLEVYNEAIQREQAARHVQVDPAEIWGILPPPPETTEPQITDATNSTTKSRSDLEQLKRIDQWQRLFHPRGAIAAADLDPEHWLCFGLRDRVPVMLGGSFAYMSKHPAATPARLADEQNLRLSGLLWPEARQRWANTAYATVESFGRGQVILFAGEPFFRGYFEGSGRLLINAVLLGPGLGTTNPMPW